eukprot:5168019-Prymnesium_polylepis.1
MGGGQPLAISAEARRAYGGADGRQPTGHTLLRRRLLRDAGWQLVSIPYWEWEAAAGADVGGERPAGGGREAATG